MKLRMKPERGLRVDRAGWVVADSRTIFRDGFLISMDGVIQGAGSGPMPMREGIVDHGPGALIPIPVNAHTHLELTALHGMVSAEGGFRSWVRELIRVRKEMGPEALVRGAKAGIRALMESGCGIVGEISSLGLTRELLADSGLAGVWFWEHLGGAISADSPLGPFCENDKIGNPSDRKTMAASLAGHGPHTTSPEVLRELKHRTREKGLPFGLHLDESEDEAAFLTTGKGPWADFLRERGIDFRDWGLPAESPVAYADRLGLLDDRTLAVHLIRSGKKEFEILKRRRVKVCLCPRSNAALHGRLPDLEGMLKAGLDPCLGTDSLAGTDSLDMFDEMAFAARSYPDVPPETIFTMATRNGAEALGLRDRFGSLNPKKTTVFTYVPVTATSTQDLLEKLVHGAFLQN